MQATNKYLCFCRGQEFTCILIKIKNLHLLRPLLGSALAMHGSPKVKNRTDIYQSHHEQCAPERNEELCKYGKNTLFKVIIEKSCKTLKPIDISLMIFKKSNAAYWKYSSKRKKNWLG